MISLGYTRDYSVASIPRHARLLRDLTGLMRRERPDIVHTHLFGAGVVGRLAARTVGVPSLATTLHRFFYAPQPAVESVLGLITDAIVVDSQAVADLIAGRCWIGRRKLHVIYNGVDPAEFAEPISCSEARTRLGLPPAEGHEPTIVGIVAHLDSNKGQSAFLDAMALLERDGLRPHLLLVGNGAARDSLRAKATALGLAERVHFAGAQRDLNLVLSALDVLVLPSKWEGFGLVLAEAMYKGLPVISTDAGGAREVVVDGETGFLTPFGDVEALRTAAGTLLRDRQLARRMGQRGRDRALQLFTTERMVGKYAALYQSLAERS